MYGVPTRMPVVVRCEGSMASPLWVGWKANDPRRHVPNPVPLGASCRRKRWGIQRGAFGGRWRQDLHANVVLRGTVDEKVRPEASLRIVWALTRGGEAAWTWSMA